MVISALRSKITIQRYSVVTDDIGNRKPDWTDVITVHATVSGEGNAEQSAGGVTVAKGACNFTIRYCEAVKGIEPTGWRVAWDGKPYDIEGIDHQGDKHKSLKLMCRKEGVNNGTGG